MKDTLLEIMRGEGTPGAAAVLSQIEDMDEADIAEAFDDLDTPQAVRLFRLLPKSLAADVFAYIIPEKKQAIVQTITDKEQASIINDLFADDAADLIEEMPANVVRRLLKNANPETRANINYLLKYPENSAGSIMTVEYVRLKEDNTVTQVFDIIRQHGVNKETIYTCYVTDPKKTLIGVVSVKDLLLADPNALVRDVMTQNVVAAHTTDTHDEIAAMFKKYGFISMPVIDSENKLVGILTVDDVLEMIEEEHTEDMSKMAAVKPSDTPYLKTGVFRHSRNRIVWLMLLMLSAMLTGFIISGFETALVTVPALMAFVPMLMDTGGNAGSQSSTLVIRGMALGEITFKHLPSVLWKETRVALICGVALGVVNFLRIIVFDGVGGQALKIATTVTLALCATVLMAKTLGCVLPMLAKRVKLDPALIASPLITTILDALSLLVYFAIATVLLGI